LISRDITVWEILSAVLRVRLLWPLYGLIYLCAGMHLKMRWVEYRTRASLSTRHQAASRTVQEPPGQKSELAAAP
jgi:hypothetical protein